MDTRVPGGAIGLASVDPKFPISEWNPLKPYEQLFMELPQGYKDDLQKIHVAKLKTSLYGLRLANYSYG